MYLIEKYFRLFFVQMEAAKSPFEINWTLNTTYYLVFTYLSSQNLTTLHALLHGLQTEHGSQWFSHKMNNKIAIEKIKIHIFIFSMSWVPNIYLVCEIHWDPYLRIFDT